MLRRVGALTLLCGAVVIGFVPTAAQADVTSPQTIQIAATDTNFGPGTAINDPMIFNQFNPTLGTLDSVSVSVLYDFSHAGTVTFYTPGTFTTTATSNNLSVSLPNGQPIASATAPDYSQTTTFNSGTMTLNNPVNLPSVTNPGAAGPVSLTSAADLALFTGNGTISIPVLASSVANFTTNNGNGAGLVTTQADAKVTVSYNYTPNAVPEPSSVVLLGLGGCGLLWYRRRRAV